jgi:hypothetical protein
LRSNYNHIKMKKLVYLLAAGSMAFVACQNSPSYKVTGSVEDITDGDTIYLQEYAGGNLVKLDSAIVKSGTFVFTGKQDTAVNRYITYMKGDKRYFTDLFLENGNINVTLGKESKVSGTPNNDAYQKFKDGFMALSKEMNEMYQKAQSDTSLTEEQVEAIMAEIEKKDSVGKEMMTKGKAWLNMTWSGDAVWAIEEAEGVGIHLDYEVPVEGSNVWYDGWVIPKYARNKKAASYFINYLCRPDVALRNMDACGYVSAVATPEILEAKIDTTLSYFADLSYFFGPAADSIQIDKVQYPDRTVVERCAMIRDSGDKTELVLEMWSRVKGDNLGVGVVIVILVSAGIMVVFTVYRKLQRYQHEKAQYHRRNHRRKK